MKRVWLLNLGAETEFESRQLSQGAQRKCVAQAKRLAAILVPPNDVWFSSVPPMGPFDEGRAFLATPTAVEQLRGCGASVLAPSLDVLRRANARSFSNAQFPQKGVHMIREQGELQDGGERLLKREFGFAGRGQRRVGRTLSPADRLWLQASLRRGPVTVEPWLTIETEVGVPGFVRSDARVAVGQPVEQLVVNGQWSRSLAIRGAVPTAALRSACRRAGEALSSIGYFGAYNIDAHRSFERGWTLVSEINARYTMGWALGWDERPDLTRLS